MMIHFKEFTLLTRYENHFIQLLKPFIPPNYPQATYDVVASTIKSVSNFDPQHDCEMLRKAMKGFGTDESTLINVLCKRNWRQRCEVVKTFKELYGKELLSEIDKETSGNFRRVLKRLLKSPADLDAYNISKALDRLVVDDQSLIEVLGTKSNAEIEMIKEAYKKMYNNDLAEDLNKATRGDFKRLLAYIISKHRRENGGVDEELAKLDAQELYKAGPGRLGTNEGCYISIFCERSLAQLKATFDAYKKGHKKDMEMVIKSEFSGAIETGLLALTAIARSKIGFFAESLHNSMKGLGTDDATLLRIIVSRCDIDLEAIKTEYERLYGCCLQEDVRVC